MSGDVLQVVLITQAPLPMPRLCSPPTYNRPGAASALRTPSHLVRSSVRRAKG